MTRRTSVIRACLGWVSLNILSWKVLREPLKGAIPATCFLFFSIHSLPLALVPVCSVKWVTDLAEKMPKKTRFWMLCVFIFQRCAYCKHLGATIKCCEEKCTQMYHYPCAAGAGTFQDFSNLSLLCPDHIDQAPERCKYTRFKWWDLYQLEI